MITLFVIALAAIVGFEIISRVPAILHTPLMSGSNFIHGVVLIGAMIALGEAEGFWQTTLGFIAVVFGAANAVGGYVVTERMLEMFKPSDKKGK
ncbi:NAD(P) transhydrogenase subunit alpha [Wohlfahrtiimonas populi]|uniref:NAD(P) transhydrogenase subunit alpha n=1 Tax=Wohlfahrtiimonas populi TaxID=1940240 RepID=UPI00098D2FD8|nr:NAD(P) transhydrogenase subunit alpha [Wohlfahrtiimonas populi]